MKLSKFKSNNNLVLIRGFFYNYFIWKKINCDEDVLQSGRTKMEDIRQRSEERDRKFQKHFHEFDNRVIYRQWWSMDCIHAWWLVLQEAWKKRCKSRVNQSETSNNCWTPLALLDERTISVYYQVISGDIPSFLRQSKTFIESENWCEQSDRSP